MMSFTARGMGGTGGMGSGGFSRSAGSATQSAGKGGSLRDIWRAMGYLRPYWKSAAISYAAFAAALTVDTLIPLQIRWAIDGGIQGGSLRVLTTAVAIALGLYLLKALFHAVFYGLYHVYEAEAARDMRNVVYRALQRLSFGFLDRADTGQLIARATSDVDAVQNFLGHGTTGFVIAVATYVVTLAAAFYLSWQLTLLSMVTLPLLIWAAMAYARVTGPLYSQVQQQYGKLTGVMQENIAGVRVVKAFSQEEAEIGKFMVQARGLFDRSLHLARTLASRQPLLVCITGISTIAVIWAGGYMVITGVMTLGTLIAFQYYMNRLFGPTRRLAFIINQVARASASAQRIFEILDTVPEVRDRPGAYDLGATEDEGRTTTEDERVGVRAYGRDGPPADAPTPTRPHSAREGAHTGDSPPVLRPIRGEVRFEDVWFEFEPGRPVLQGIDLVVKPGQVIALVGGTGSGKSALVGLIPRFYDATRGRVLIDGLDVRDVTVASLRQHIAMVPQETFLFSASLRTNIAFGRPEAELPQVQTAAEHAQVHRFATYLPQGYDTEVGDRGVALSGGQRQRTSLARAIMVEPRILILDDATSNVDMETEFLIERALQKVLQNKTAFVIAHRLSTVRHADEVLVLEQGRIVQRGRHDDLVQQEGPYRRIYEAQMKEQEEILAARRVGAADAEAPSVVVEMETQPRG